MIYESYSLVNVNDRRPGCRSFHLISYMSFDFLHSVRDEEKRGAFPVAAKNDECIMTRYERFSNPYDHEMMRGNFSRKRSSMEIAISVALLLSDLSGAVWMLQDKYRSDL